MSCVWRPKYDDRKTGETKKQNVWHAKFNLERGGPWIRRTTGQTDKRAAQRRMAEMIEEERRLQEGLVDLALLHRRKTLDDHLKDFEDEMHGTDDTSDYIDEFMKNLREILGFVPTRTLAGLHLFKLRTYLESDEAMRKTRPGKERGGEPVQDAEGEAVTLSHRSVNKRIKALKQFGRWLEDTGRIPKSPFRRLKALNEEVDPRRVRTTFPLDRWDEFLRSVRRRPLAEAARTRVNKGVTPPECKRLRRLGQLRALACSLAREVGLRHDEVVTLAWRDLDLKNGVVTIAAENAKARRVDSLPIESGLVRRLRAYARTKPDRRPKDRLFLDERGRTVVPAPRTFQHDMKFAGVPRTNEQGHVIDFHALRTTFITALADKGTPPHRLQKLARHAKIETTMKYYTRTKIEDLRWEIEREALTRATSATVTRSA